MCIRHWVNGNSAKLYNFLNNLRAETTMNFPGQFKIFRHKEGQPNDGPKQRMPMRKGIADASVRGQVSKQINDRFMNQIATFEDRSPAHKVLDPFTRPFTSQGRRVRALDLLGKDRALLEALSDPKYALSGVTNKMLRDVLRGTAWAKGGTDKQLSARISRHLRLLRQHGILKKVPKQHKYLLQPKGHQLTTTLSALLHATTKSLIEAA